MSSCSTKKGTTIFAYFYLVAGVLSTLTLAGFVFLNLILFLGMAEHTGAVAIIFHLLLGVVVPATVIAFASLLVHGVRRKNPNLLIAYIVFGILKILIIVGFSLFLVFDHKQCKYIWNDSACSQPLILLSPVFLCVIYSGFLVMIGFTAREYRRDRQLKPNSIYDPLTTHPTYASAPTETL